VPPRSASTMRSSFGSSRAPSDSRTASKCSREPSGRWCWIYGASGSWTPSIATMRPFSSAVYHDPAISTITSSPAML